MAGEKKLRSMLIYYCRFMQIDNWCSYYYGIIIANYRRFETCNSLNVQLIRSKIDDLRHLSIKNITIFVDLTYFYHNINNHYHRYNNSSNVQFILWIA